MLTAAGTVGDRVDGLNLGADDYLAKPFAFAEWGVWGRDDPGFVGQFFGFLKSHKRVRMAVYYQSASLKPEFALANHPASRAALRRAVRWPRLTGVAP